MNTTSTIITKLGRYLLGAILGALLLTSASQAATITLECKVAGYSTAGWIKVVPGSNTGGRVVRDAYGRFYTDRVQRSEPLRITYAPQGWERCWGGNWGGIYKFTGGYRSFANFGAVALPFAMVVTCPTDPSWDQVYADISTSLGYFRQRIPIGTR